MLNSKLITLQCSDLKTVNAARVSMAVTHDTYEEVGDTKLINYLAKHAHWTPFAHNREVIFFPIESKIMYYQIIELLSVMLSPEQQASLVMQSGLKSNNKEYIAVKTSLYGWAQIVKYINLTQSPIGLEMLELIVAVLKHKYPHGVKALLDTSILDAYNETSDLAIANHTVFNLFVRELESKMFDITFYETVPIFIARQRFKTVIMTVYNELSRRYVDNPPTLYSPDPWRQRPEKSIKQGSGGSHPENELLTQQYADFSKLSLQFYHKLINSDSVAPEMARMVLPQSMMTEYYVTSNIDAWDRFVDQRTDSHAQKEIQDLAKLADEQLNDIKSAFYELLNNPNYANVDVVQEMNKIGVF